MKKIKTVILHKNSNSVLVKTEKETGRIDRVVLKSYNKQNESAFKERYRRRLSWIRN